MDNKQELSQEKFNQLLGLVSKKMGVAPDVLKAKLESGSFDNLIKGMKEEDAKKFCKMAEDPSAINSLLKNPDAVKNLSGMLGKNGSKR